MSRGEWSKVDSTELSDGSTLNLYWIRGAGTQRLALVVDPTDEYLEEAQGGGGFTPTELQIPAADASKVAGLLTGV